MTLRRAVSFAFLGGLLMLGAWVYVRAQSPRKPAAARAAAVPEYPATPTLQPGSPTRFPQGVAPETVLAAEYAASSTRPSLAPADMRLSEQIPARVELTSGLVLSGTLAAEPLACQTAFGAANIPLGTIRGVRLHETDSAADEPAAATGSTAPPQLDSVPQPSSPATRFPSPPSFGTFPPAGAIPGAAFPSPPEKSPAGPAATVILANGDSLTVALQAEILQLKTEWGVASIEISHVRSILLPEQSGAGEGSAEVTHEWQQHDGRWQLHRLEDAADEGHAEDAVDDLPALPHYQSGGAAPESPPDLASPASDAPAFRPQADDAPSLLPPQRTEPAESSDAGGTNAAPAFEPA